MAQIVPRTLSTSSENKWPNKTQNMNVIYLLPKILFKTRCIFLFIYLDLFVSTRWRQCLIWKSRLSFLDNLPHCSSNQTENRTKKQTNRMFALLYEPRLVLGDKIVISSICIVSYHIQKPLNLICLRNNENKRILLP